MPHNTLSSIEDWFTHQSQTLDWKQRELDYAYADHYDRYDGPFDSNPVSFTTVKLCQCVSLSFDDSFLAGDIRTVGPYCSGRCIFPFLSCSARRRIDSISLRWLPVLKRS